MNKATAPAKFRRNSDAVRALGATAYCVFGSTDGDEAGAAISRRARSGRAVLLLDLAGIKVLLEDELGVEATSQRDSLHPLLRERIERSAIRVF